MKKINIIDALGNAGLQFVDEAEKKHALLFFKSQRIKKQRIKVLTALIAAVLLFVTLTVTVIAKTPDDGRHSERSDNAYTTAAAGTHKGVQTKANDTSPCTTTAVGTELSTGTKPVTDNTCPAGDDTDETDYTTDPVTTDEPETATVTDDKDGGTVTLVTPVTDKPLSEPVTEPDE